MEERGLLTQLVAMSDRTTHDAALHITTPFVGRNYAIGYQECRRTDVVRDHAQRRMVQIFGLGLTASCSDQVLEQINLVVAVHVLQDGRQTLQTHASVHAGSGQRLHIPLLVHVELHEHVVPDFDETVTVFIGRSGRATGDVFAVVVEDFRAGATRAGVGHHPEVVGLVTAAFVVANANHALWRQTDFLGPDVVCLVIFRIHRGQQLFLGQLVHLCQQLPCPLEGFTLEVVTKRPVAQHFEEGMVACGVTHILQVIVLATCTQAGLHRCSSVVRAFVGTQEHILELDHARVGEHQCGVVAGHQRTGFHDGVALGCKKFQERLADVRNGEFGSAHG